MHFIKLEWLLITLNITSSYAIIALIIIFCWLLVFSNYAKSLAKTSIVLCVCLAFVGQAMASTIMSYQMISMMNMSSQSAEESQNMMTMMDHSNHNMSAKSSGVSSAKSSSVDDSDESSNQDCCNSICQCYTGGCSNVATIMNSLAPNLFIDNPDKILNTSRVALRQQSNSLYRPPILS